MSNRKRPVPPTIRLRTTIPSKPVFRLSLEGWALALLLSLALGGVVLIAIWSVISE